MNILSRVVIVGHSPVNRLVRVTLQYFTRHWIVTVLTTEHGVKVIVLQVRI